MSGLAPTPEKVLAPMNLPPGRISAAAEAKRKRKPVAHPMLSAASAAPAAKEKSRVEGEAELAPSPLTFSPQP